MGVRIENDFEIWAKVSAVSVGWDDTTLGWVYLTYSIYDLFSNVCFI